MVAGDVVHVTLAPHRFILVENEQRTAYDTLREKLHWNHTSRHRGGGSPRHARGSDSA
jgi:hypothetical protein